MERNSLIDNIKIIESELNSFEEEKNESSEILKGEKNKIIKEAKSGVFEEMLSEIEAREKTKKKESVLDKLFKLF
jgi:hypothetical protein